MGKKLRKRKQPKSPKRKPTVPICMRARAWKNKHVGTMAEEKLARSKGVVCKFNDQMGYGFIRPDEGGKDLFAHQTAIKSDVYRTVNEQIV